MLAASPESPGNRPRFSRAGRPPLLPPPGTEQPPAPPGRPARRRRSPDSAGYLGGTACAAALRNLPLRPLASGVEADTAAGRDSGSASLQAASRPREAEAPEAAAPLREAPAAASLVSPSAGDLGKKLYRVLCRDMMKADGPTGTPLRAPTRTANTARPPLAGKSGEARPTRAPVAQRPIRRRLGLRGWAGSRLRRALASVGGATRAPPPSSGWRASRLSLLQNSRARRGYPGRSAQRRRKWLARLLERLGSPCEKPRRACCGNTWPCGWSCGWTERS